MANPRSFISFDFDHNETDKNLFVGQSRNSKTPFSIEDWSAKSEMPQDKWREIVENKINYCNVLIVLVGQYMASATGVESEIKMSIRNNVPFFGVYVDGANSNSNLPSSLSRGRVVFWDWSEIANAIDQCMKEGKNN